MNYYTWAMVLYFRKNSARYFRAAVLSEQFGNSAAASKFLQLAVDYEADAKAEERALGRVSS